MKLILAILLFSCATLVQNLDVPYIKILSSECSTTFISQFMRQLDRVRSGHQCERLKWDKKLSNYSRVVAIAYAQNGWVGGADLLKNGAAPPQQWNVHNYGELSRRLPANESLGDDFGMDPVELVNYWYGNGDLGPASGYEWYGVEPTREQAARFAYYTQLIWRSSKDIGMSCVVALNESDSTKHYQFVANFYTPPYDECRFRQNVIPPEDTGNPEWDALRDNAGSLKPTEECQKLRIGMNYCPFGFEKKLLSYINEMRKESSTIDLKLNATLRVYSQNYANWLATQSENISGNQPLSQCGGNVEIEKFYSVSPEGSHSVKLESAYIHSMRFESQRYRYSILDAFGKEPEDSVKEECKDFTRATWASSRGVGIGCALQWLPDRNQSRSIVILNFYPPGNVKGGYEYNVRDFHDDYDNDDDETL